MNAITLLKDDHKRVKALFREYQKTNRGAHKTRARIVDRITKELSEHSAIEESVFYPECRARIPEADDDVLESLEEHHILKWVLSELEGMSPDDERFEAKVTVLIENVRHHVEEEEQELFPQVRAAMGRKRLAELGQQMEELKKRAPKHPQPRERLAAS